MESGFFFPFLVLPFEREDHSSGSDGKASVCNAEDPGSIPGLGRSPGEGSGSPLQYSCLENPTDLGTWQATVHGVAKSRTQLHFHFERERADDKSKESKLFTWMEAKCTFFGGKAEKVVCYIHGTRAVTSTGVYQEASIKTAGEF